MKETTGYPLRVRKGISAFALTSVLALGLAACGDDGQDSSNGQGALPTASSKAPAASSSGVRLVDGGKALASSDGTRVPVNPKLVTGYVDAATLNGDYIDISGWAAPAELSQPADFVVAIVKDKSVAGVKPSGERPDLVDGYDRPGLRKAGFSMSIPRSALECSAPSQGLKTYGIAGNAAGPLEWLADVPKLVADAC